jgi:hypothetical protein
MPSLWEVLQDIVSITRHVDELQERITATEQALLELERKASDRIRSVEVDVASLRVSQENMREMVRSEVATAIADVRVRYAEEQLRRARLPEESGD